MDEISHKIIELEKNLPESDLYRIKKTFIEQYRQYFLYGDYVRWSYEKPLGYPGDFKIIDDIYKNSPTTKGLDGLIDSYFLELPPSKATRERKEDFKKIIFDFVKKNKEKNLRIMNLGSGSSREIKELLDEDKDGLFNNVIFDCYDFDERAIDYAKKLLNNPKNVNFFQKNVIRLALKKDIETEIPYKYDLIYSTGLFDYFDERVAIRLVSNLKKLLKKERYMVISNYRDRYSNPSVGLMEWIVEWYLIYRTEEEFAKIFLNAGFPQKDIKIQPQCSKVMQYCFAINNE
jgi:SAM-dependent methyltransferase